MSNRAVRIGAGCSVDITLALPQMVRGGNVQYIVIDYMTEVAVSGMAADRYLDPKAGFGTDLVGPELARELHSMLGSGIKLVTNAGGLNPHACAAAIRELAVKSRPNATPFSRPIPTPFGVRNSVSGGAYPRSA